MTNLLTVKDVQKTFGPGENVFYALRGVSFSVQSGEFLALAGSSGSGKTTMLNLIGGLDRPSEGTIQFEGRDLRELNSEELSHFRGIKLGFIFQTFNLLPVLTAVENVEYPILKRKDLSAQEKSSRAKKALEKVGLGAFLDRRPNQLSGGQRQRVAIARALVHNPSLIVADEPTANLDRKTAQEVLSLMRNLNQTEGVTFIFSTHDPEIISMAKRVIYLSDGSIVREELK